MDVLKDGDLAILHKLWYNRCFSRSKTIYIDNLVKGFPSHLIGKIHDDVNKLIKRNILIKIPHKYGYKVYINLDYKDQIYQALKNYYKSLK